MNPRQRRGVLLIALSIVGALAVFIAVVNFVADVRRQVGPMMVIIETQADTVAYEPINPASVREVRVPEQWAPPNALTSAVDMAGRVSPVDLPAGTRLQQGMLVDPPVLEEGQKELAIMVDGETGVAGQISRGSLVDIVATFQPIESGEQILPAQATVIVQNAEILRVGDIAIEGEQTANGFAEGEVVPVTFALDPAEMLRVTYAESFAQKVRLVLRTPTDDSELADTQSRYQPLPEGLGQGNDPQPLAPQPTPAPAAPPAQIPATQPPPAAP